MYKILAIILIVGCNSLLDNEDSDDSKGSKGNCLLSCTGGAQCHDDVSQMDCLSLQCLTDADTTGGYEWYVDDQGDMDATPYYIKWMSPDPSIGYFESLQTCDAICASILGGATFILPRYVRPECVVIELD